MSGAVSLNQVVTYSGTLTLTNVDSTGNYGMQGSGQLQVPSVLIPGVGPLVLYDGQFSLAFKNGGIYQFLQKYTRFNVAGWQVKIDELDFLTDGVQAKGSIIVPQYVKGLAPINASATVKATASGGIQLVGGSISITKIALAGAFSLEGISISYDGPSDTFKGGGTLTTDAVGLSVRVEVARGCLNSATLTVEGVPVAIDATGAEFVNYGVDGTGFCTGPLGIGLHTDITFASNPDPDLLELSDLSLMYYPLATLKGSGTVKVLGSDLADVAIYLNYSDADYNCAKGLCIHGTIGLPSTEEAWLLVSSTRVWW